MAQGVMESKSLANEMLYGRAGYLYTLLMLQKEIGETIISKNTVINVRCGTKQAHPNRQILSICASRPNEIKCYQSRF